jgi:hypothetical protein
LIFALARSLNGSDASMAARSAALVGLEDEASRQNLGPLPVALCEAALTFLGVHLPSSDPLIEGAREARRLPELGVVGTPSRRSFQRTGRRQGERLSRTPRRVAR